MFCLNHVKKRNAMIDEFLIVMCTSAGLFLVKEDKDVFSPNVTNSCLR